MMEPTPAPGQFNWRLAMETQLEAFGTIKHLTNSNSREVQTIIKNHGFVVDKALLEHSVPYAWSRESIQATLAASQSIPMDAELTAWNLDSNAAWWWFEDPLPYETVELVSQVVGIRALNMGWLIDGNGQRQLGLSAWCDAAGTLGSLTITPSQTGTWLEGKKLHEVLVDSRAKHDRLYGPKGIYSDVPTIGVDKFITAMEGIAKFVLAGLTWLNQRVLIQEDGHLERHRRKDFNRQTKQELRSVQVIHLRRATRIESGPKEGEIVTETVDWAGRWVVGGHFRQQPCGPGRASRKLVWIHPFVKGPDDKPFLEPKRKVYRVDR